MADGTVITGSVGALTYSQLVGFIAVGLIFIEIFNAVMKAINTWRDEKRRKNKPVDTLEQKVDEHEEKLSRDHKRLNDLEDGNRIMMRAMMAILSHEINGNSVDKLTAAMDEIHNYLVNR